ncbi:hypothetical protein EVAR_104017_1 [Eumeta japonica]|uniref:Uncharacterized protein n=1 Tax=Eumeta variegata TaxID=151549 RepID=A0A4C1Y0K3_EUMVA|nr:hypothetical protein EVAR_104017_1 [Eumeta japonica]
MIERSGDGDPIVYTGHTILPASERRFTPSYRAGRSLRASNRVIADAALARNSPGTINDTARVSGALSVMLLRRPFLFTRQIAPAARPESVEARSDLERHKTSARASGAARPRPPIGDDSSPPTELFVYRFRTWK